MPASNMVELTVGELSGALKRTIEDRFGLVRVRGEISNYRGQHSSGHAYFCLKDDTARLDAVIWKTAFARLRVKPEEGMDVIATGRVTTFPGKSSYQIVIETIEPAGIGALMALLEQRRKTLAAEGLFDEARKRRLPFLPRAIGVVTSPTGAVIRDILHRLDDRFPRHVLVWPVRVQGETAAAEVAAAIDGFNALPHDGTIPRPDVIIVARGGGSLEDLWAFNEEIVVRAAAASAIPLIAAVGHETDWTLIDHAADLRAPTPSGAAEKAVPVRGDLLNLVADLARRHAAAQVRLIERRRHDLRALSRTLATSDGIVAMPRQRLDRAHDRLRAVAMGAGDRRHLDLSRLANRLARQAPRTRLAHQTQALAALEQRMAFCLERARDRAGQRLLGAAQRLARMQAAFSRDIPRAQGRVTDASRQIERAFAALVHRRGERLARFGQLLNSLGYRQVLARGFALVRDAGGNPIHQCGDIRPASVLDIEFADGHIEAVAGGPRSIRKLRSSTKTEQGLLF